MGAENEMELRKSEYALRALKIPHQSLEVFARNPEQGNYGLSAEVVDTIFEYAHLQQTLNYFNGLTFSAEFIAKLPENLQTNLGQNLFPGIPLSNLEIPTTDKVLLAELLIADTLTDSLSKFPVEVWVTPDIQKKLKNLNCPVGERLQKIDYGQLPLEAKNFLIGVMEYQEMQVHTILLAHERFPEGVPAALGIRALFLPEGENERTVKFGSLEDLETQYTIANEALNNPLQLLIGRMIQQMRTERAAAMSKNTEEVLIENRKKRKRPFNAEQEAQQTWWLYQEREDHFDVTEAVADYLRPQYAQKTLYEILAADTDEKKQEVLSAFWRRRGSIQIDLGDECWVEHNLDFKPDGTLKLHYRDGLNINEESNISIKGALKHYRDVAMVDQAVKWIRQETEAMKVVREKWEYNGFDQVQLVECSLVQAIGQGLSDSAQEEIGKLPKWFLGALDQETRYYHRLPMEYKSPRSMDDLLFSLPTDELQTRNLLKAYFVRSKNDLIRYRSLLTTPEELYKVLGLDSSATQDQAREAYRQIAKETQAIHISSPNDFNEGEWSRMNLRFMEATRAYKVLMKHRIGDAHITTLGRISSYFEN